MPVQVVVGGFGEGVNCLGSVCPGGGTDYLLPSDLLVVGCGYYPFN